MGVCNEQGGTLEPETGHMMMKDRKGGSPRSRRTPLSHRRQLSKRKDMMFVVGGWTQEDPSCLVEQFCPEYNEWRLQHAMVNNRGKVAVGTLDGMIYTVGGEDHIRCYSSVESWLCAHFPQTATPYLSCSQLTRYNPDTDSWSTDCSTLEQPRSGVCLVEMDDTCTPLEDTMASLLLILYDPRMNTWSKQAAMLGRRSGGVAAVLQGQLYVMGGNDGVMALNSVGGWTQEDPSCLVEQFCPEYNEWRAAARMVNNRGKVAVGTLDGMIYTVGGEDHIRCYSSVESWLCAHFPQTATPYLSCSQLTRYNPDTDSWSIDVAPLSSPRSGVCLVEMDGYLYAIGGHDGIAAINTVERYDPRMNTWSKQAAMLGRRSGGVAAVLQGQLYVMGGNDGVMALNSVERYNPVDGTWSICAHMLSPRENAGCTVYLGHIYVSGGRDELNLELCGVERFDPDNMRWTPVKRMRSKRDNMSLVVFNGALTAVGGSDGVTNLKTIEVYCHVTNTW
ncbi:hypothetical protein JOQ06_011971, partial [Pogonophryne albipinna]